MAELVIVSTFYACILLWKLLVFCVVFLFRSIVFIIKLIGNLLAWCFMLPGTKYSGDWEPSQTKERNYYNEYSESNNYYQYQSMEKPESCYDILGVSPEDDLATIKKVYRNLSKIYHPDVNPSSVAADKFKKITEAWNQIQEIKKV